MGQNTVGHRGLSVEQYALLSARLQIDCGSCCGLCCTALYRAKTEGFPEDKAAGIPCKHLLPGFQCEIHGALEQKAMRGCMSYDCFGAGQRVTRAYPPGVNWRTSPQLAAEMFETFLTVYHLYQMEWYLLEAAQCSGEALAAELDALIAENEEMTSRAPAELARLKLEGYRERVNRALKQAWAGVRNAPRSQPPCKDCLGKDFRRANLSGVDFSMALLIAANLEGCTLTGANFLGADLRDANVKNTDLGSSLFLTQMQINSTRGNANTELPPYLSRPASWRG